mmetsp:Transcript_110519/g.165424  ORF Transcript_110519/g.165424 Transcript_110519/m.165424 type:complete len:438 (-) Transcript_110519:644-1957(-)
MGPTVRTWEPLCSTAAVCNRVFVHDYGGAERGPDALEDDPPEQQLQADRGGHADLHQAHDRRHPLQFACHSGGSRCRAPSQTPIHGRLHYPRDPYRGLAVHAARRRQGYLRVVELGVVLGGSSRAVDGPPQDGVRVAPEARGRAAHRRRLAQPRLPPPPGLPCAAWLLAAHPRQACRLGPLDPPLRVLGAADARRLDPLRPTLSLPRRWTPSGPDLVREHGECGGRGSRCPRPRSRPPRWHARDPSVRVERLHCHPPQGAEAAAEEAHLRRGHGHQPEGWPRRRPPVQRPGGGPERADPVPAQPERSGRALRVHPLDWCDVEGRGPLCAVPLRWRATLLGSALAGARGRGHPPPCGEALGGLPRFRPHRCPRQLGAIEASCSAQGHDRQRQRCAQRHGPHLTLHAAPLGPYRYANPAAAGGRSGDARGQHVHQLEPV